MRLKICSLWCAVLVTLILTVSAFSTTAQAVSTPYIVVGDSLSATSQVAGDNVVAWPELVFGDQVTNNAIGGAQTTHFLSTCSITKCWWLNGAAEADMLLIMIGHNDISAGRSPQEIAENIRTMVSFAVFYGISDIRLIHAPYTYDVERFGTFYDRSENRRALDELTVLQKALCDEVTQVTCAVDLRNVIRLDNGGIHPDGVHFTQLGSLAAALKVYEHLNHAPEPSTAFLLLQGIFLLAIRSRKRQYEYSCIDRTTMP